VTKKENIGNETPLMKQYNGIKTKYPDALLLFRIGDFYETFGADAIKTAQILGIVLTKRHNGSAGEVELAGFPHHSLDIYLPKLVRAGQRVAICDQLEDPKLTKTIVKRGVTELVTPGVVFNEQVLENKKNNFLASIYFSNDMVGISFLDISTGEFLLAEGNLNYADKLLQSFKPSEILFNKKDKIKFEEFAGNNFNSFALEDWIFQIDYATDILQKHFGTNSLKGFGIEGNTLGVIAAGVAMHYLADTQHHKLKHISNIARIEQDKYVWLDKFTIRNLELLHSQNENAKTLIDILDNTISPMGSRLLKRWLIMPLKEIQPINERLDAVDFFVKNESAINSISNLLSQVGDLERLISKVAAMRVTPRELLQLKKALGIILPLKKNCQSSKNNALKFIADQLNPCTEILIKLGKELHPDAPAMVQKGKVIANGVNTELDELRNLVVNGKDKLLEIQQREIQNTGISSLKIAFNNVFGYYIEVRNTFKNKVPPNWIRKQTLVSAERYITEELKEYESKILGAEEKILNLETKLFNELVLSTQEYIQPIQINAQLIAKIDCFISFALTAINNNYTKPNITETDVIDIKLGRHPVIEKQLPVGEDYVANDIFLDTQSQQIIMITGPNMSGKSALLRQTALIVLMAQIGSFVPAAHASVGLVDKIFTRVGASDNISQGESTFMVEMNETASILNNLSSRSLILLDEIGRGTSTYDGISIAWAIAEYIHEHPTHKAKTLFATHYHELNEMESGFKRIKNYNVSVRETEKKVIFLRKLVKGGSEHSFGIHVAQMAGMPKNLLKRANEILSQLEKSHAGAGNETSKKTKETDYQLSFFQLNDPVLEQIKDELTNLDINILTPVEALMKLNEIKKLVGGK
jgi:DNA mismatch repair protein MutS